MVEQYETYAAKIIGLGAETLAGLTAVEIAERVGCGVNYVRIVMRDCGLAYVMGQRGKPSQGITDAALDLWAQGATLNEAAAGAGSTPKSVGAMLHRARKAGDPRAVRRYAQPAPGDRRAAWFRT